MNTEKYEDTLRKEKQQDGKQERTSGYCDLVYYPSGITPGLTLGMRVLKPEKPGYIKVGTHGWHMTIPDFQQSDKPLSEYLEIDVDMRGRAYSDGKPDCNGWELYDVIDAVNYAKQRYAEYIIDPEIIFFEAGSGGGGNAYAIAGKFPDFFAHIVAQCGISDYALWYRDDTVGEFRDEMDVWIGSPDRQEAYASRSGLTSVQNLCTPIAIVHGETDVRVPSVHARRFVEKAGQLGKAELVTYLEMPGVGTREHFGNASPQQMAEVAEFCESQRQAHKTPVEIPRRGTMTVCGYLVTKHFSVILRDVDCVARLTYDLDRNYFEISGVKQGEYTLKVGE